jgi:hypothetical protein
MKKIFFIFFLSFILVSCSGTNQTNQTNILLTFNGLYENNQNYTLFFDMNSPDKHTIKFFNSIDEDPIYSQIVSSTIKLRIPEYEDKPGFLFTGWKDTSTLEFLNNSTVFYEDKNYVANYLKLPSNYNTNLFRLGNSLSLNKTINTFINADKITIYPFYTNRSGSITIETSLISGDPTLSLYDSNFSFLASHDDIDVNSGNLNAKITYSVTGNKIYFVGLIAHEKKVGDTKLTIKSSYTESEELISFNPLITEQISVQVITHENGMKYPNIPESLGFIFAGWYSNAQGSGDQFDFSKNIDSNISVYAKWVSSLDYDSDDINLKSKDGGLAVQTTKLSNEFDFSSVEKLPVINRSGYNFLGWFTENNGKGIQVTDNKGIIKNIPKGKENLQLYPYENPNAYQIILNNTYDSLTDKTKIDVLFDNEIENLDYIPKVEGYQFEGYFTTKEEQYFDSNMKSTRKYDVANNLNLYAKYTPNKYEVTLNTSDTLNRAVILNLQDEEYGYYLMKTGEIKYFYDKNPFFAGWYLDEKRETPYLFNKDIDTNIFLYGKYQDEFIQELINNEFSYPTKEPEILKLNEQRKVYGESWQSSFNENKRYFYISQNEQELQYVLSVPTNESCEYRSLRHEIKINGETVRNFENSNRCSVSMEINVEIGDVIEFIFSAVSTNISLHSASPYPIALGNIITGLVHEIEFNTYFILPIPTKNDLDFIGWYYNDLQVTNHFGKSLFSWKYSSNITLTPKFE